MEYRLNWLRNSAEKQIGWVLVTSGVLEHKWQASLKLHSRIAH